MQLNTRQDDLNSRPKDNTRGRTKSPIGGAALDGTLSKFKSLDLNLIQALGHRGNPKAKPDLQRSTSHNAFTMGSTQSTPKLPNGILENSIKDSFNTFAAQGDQN